MASTTVVQTVWFSDAASPELKALRPVVRRLRDVYEKFNNAELDDCAFWYSERPHVGFLSAAVWLEGGTALEEFRAKRPEWMGRADLAFRFRNRRYDCEAKHCRVNLSRLSEATERTGRYVQSATDTVKYLKNESNIDRVLALCFVSPEIREKLYSNFDTRLKQWMELLKSEQCDALVWIGVAKGTRPIGETMLYPGALMAIREVR